MTRYPFQVLGICNHFWTGNHWTFKGVCWCWRGGGTCWGYWGIYGFMSLRSHILELTLPSYILCCSCLVGFPAMAMLVRYGSGIHFSCNVALEQRQFEKKKRTRDNGNKQRICWKSITIFSLESRLESKKLPTSHLSRVDDIGRYI